MKFLKTTILGYLFAFFCVAVSANDCYDIITDDLSSAIASGLSKSELDEAYSIGASSAGDFEMWSNLFVVKGKSFQLDLEGTKVLDFGALENFTDVTRRVSVIEGQVVVQYSSKVDNAGDLKPIIGADKANVTETINGNTVTRDEYGFPIFDSKFDTFVPERMLGSGNLGEHFQFANERMRELLTKNPGFETELNLTAEQIKHFMSYPAKKKSPDGLTWHHHQDTGRMQLIDLEVHADFGHTGGHSIWGGKNIRDVE